MSMICLTRVDYNSTRPIYVNLACVATVERCENHTRLELTTGGFVNVVEMPSTILVGMGQWDAAETAARDEKVLVPA